MVELVKQNYVRMEQEVKKLATFVGAGGTVTLKDVQSLVSRDLEGEIFNFIKAIVTRDTKKVIELHQAFTKSTQDVMGIIAMIGRTFRDLLTTLKLLKSGYKQHDIAQFYNVSDGRAYYMVKDAKTFEETDLANYVKKWPTLIIKSKAARSIKISAWKDCCITSRTEKKRPFRSFFYAIEFSALAKRDFWRAA